MESCRAGPSQKKLDPPEVCAQDSFARAACPAPDGKLARAYQGLVRGSCPRNQGATAAIRAVLLCCSYAAIEAKNKESSAREAGGRRGSGCPDPVGEPIE